VAATEVTEEDFPPGFWPDFWKWYWSGGLQDVVAYLAQYDISKFDAKAPPEKTAAFWTMVGAGTASEVPEMNDVLNQLGRPEVVTVARIVQASASGHSRDLYEWLSDRKNRRSIPHRLDDCGYLPVLNVTRKDNRWVINKKEQAIYGRRDVTPAARFKAADAFKVEEERKAAEVAEKYRKMEEEAAKRRE
jgi:hypothetical protein